jgi:hypothetical protein
VSLRTFRRMAENGTLDRFGWMSLAGKAEYKTTDKLILERAVGGFWAAGKTGCPASVRTATGAWGRPTNSSREPALNFTGASRFVGWEIDVGLRYTYAGPELDPRVGCADYGVPPRPIIVRRWMPGPSLIE